MRGSAPRARTQGTTKNEQHRDSTGVSSSRPRSSTRHALPKQPKKAARAAVLSSLHQAVGHTPPKRPVAPARQAINPHRRHRHPPLSRRRARPGTISNSWLSGGTQHPPCGGRDRAARRAWSATSVRSRPIRPACTLLGAGIGGVTPNTFAREYTISTTALGDGLPSSSALTKLPNGCPFRWGTVGGWGPTRLLFVGRF